MKKIIGIPILGLAIVFIYFGVDKFIHPIFWTSFIPIWMDGLFALRIETWNIILAIIELFMSLFLIIPKTRKLGSALITLYLIPIILITFPSDIAVRDIGLLSLSIYLALHE